MKKLFRRFERENNILAFGVQLDTCKYRLGLARYVGISDAIHREVQTLGELKVLDVACGDGILKRWCNLPNVILDGIDVRESNIRSALASGYQHVVQGNIVEGLPFPDAAYDVVVLSHIVEHLQHPERLMPEVWRVLRPGGMVIVGIPMHTWFSRWLRINVVPVLVPRKSPEILAANFGHVQFFTMSSIIDLMHDYTIEDIRGFRIFSAGRYLPLENWYWYYKLNTALGKAFPRLTAEINLVGRKYV